MKMKNFLTILLAVLLACGVLPSGTFAEEQGLFLYTVKEDGTAQITGISDTDIETLEIPAELDGIPVTSVDGTAISDCPNLRSAVIPEGVVSLGMHVFNNCAALESVSIPDSLVSVEKSPFSYCRKIKTVEVSPDHPVFAVENRALVNRQDQALVCVLDYEDAGTYEVAQGIRKIGDNAFEDSLFSSVLLPDSITSVGMLAFGKCRNLTEMIIPEGVTTVKSMAFLYCEKLESVTIPDSLTRIDKAVFVNTPALAEIRISPDHPAYEMNGSFLVDRKNREIMTALSNTPMFCEIPEGIRKIGVMAFLGNPDLTEVIVPEGVTRISVSAFNGCTGLRVIILPASVDTIMDNAFKDVGDLLIKAPAGSWAEQYARENGYSFEALPEETDGTDGGIL